jgi:hypothetical protein
MLQRTLQKQAQCLGCGTLVDVATASIAAKESMEELERSDSSPLFRVLVGNFGSDKRCLWVFSGVCRIKSELSSPSAGKNLKVMVAAVLHLLGCCRDVLHSSIKQLARVCMYLTSVLLNQLLSSGMTNWNGNMSNV